MCFFNYNGVTDEIEPITEESKKTATEDIPVFKVVFCKKDFDGRLKFVSYYYRKEYSENEEYKSPIQVYDTNISVGIHSYLCGKCSTNAKMDFFCGALLKVVSVVSEKHQYKYQSISDSLYRMDCVIPKGSTYYANGYGEAVSDKLRVISFTKL